MRKLTFLVAATLVSGMMISADVADAQRYHRDRHGRVYRGRHDRYRYRCDGGNGAVGTIAGGVGGALIGNALGGGTLGTVAGGVGGGLLGRHLDKQHTRHRRGC